MILVVFKLMVLPLFMTWQLQGGQSQNIQVTAPAEVVQHATINLQGNNRDSFYLQPALGGEVLEAK